MPRMTEHDKVLILSKLEEEWSIRRVATYNGLNKSTVLLGAPKFAEQRSSTLLSSH
jgi:hypothetical protein